jgi:predicted nucleic acid-binding protein
MTNTAAAKVETYRLTAANGRHIRMATRVVLANGEVINFIDRMSKRDALRNAEFELARRSAR